MFKQDGKKKKTNKETYTNEYEVIFESAAHLETYDGDNVK